MKNLAKILWIIAIGAVIAAGLNACITVTPHEKTEEELVFEKAAWEKNALANPPSLNGFEKLSGMSFEVAHFNSILADSANQDGVEMKFTTNGVQTTRKLIYMANNTWYALTAPELPGITYYCYREGGESFSSISVYKSK